MESRREFASRVLAGAAIAAGLPLRGEPSNLTRRLQERFIAPCCWSESVAVHRSEGAVQMRAEIASLVESGKSEDEIIAYYVAKHGERILLEPRGQKLTWLTAMPFMGLGLGGVFLVGYLKRKRPATVPVVASGAGVAVSDEELEW